MNKVVVTITGPSASGKSTLEKQLAEIGFARAISTTTREKRPGEVNGVSYNFVSADEFVELAAAGAFAETVEFNGKMYGVEIAEFEKAFAKNMPVVVVVEPNGARQVKATAVAHGWKILQTYVDGNTGDLIGRFLNREGEITPERFAHVQSRLNHLVSVEVEWRYLSAWDIIFDTFEEQTQDRVIALIRDWAAAQREIPEAS